MRNRLRVILARLLRFLGSWYRVFLLLLFIGSIAIRVLVMMQHRVPSGDEGPWLRMASRCGTPAFLQSKVIEHDLYFKKTIPHPEDNRSPLYPVLIKGVQFFVKDYYTAGQVLNLLVWSILFFTLANIISKLAGSTVPLVTLLYCSLSPHFILFTAYIYPDLLFMTLCLILLAYHRWFTEKTNSVILSGLCTGALILIKSTAIFIIPVLLYSIYKYRTGKFWFGKSLLYISIIVIVVFPWALRNIREFGSPFYQFSEYNLYVDNFNKLLTIGIERPSLHTVLKQKGLTHVFLERPLQGFSSMIAKFGKFDEHLSIALFSLSIIGCIIFFRKKRNLIAPLLIFSIPYALFMGYTAYAVWVHRFTMIFYLFIYASAGIAVYYIGELFYSKFRKKLISLPAMITLAALPLFTIVYPLEFYCSQRGSDKVFDRDARSVIDTIKRAIPENSVIFSSFLSDYCFLHDFAVIDNLNYHSINDLTSFLDSYNTSYCLFNCATDIKLIQDIQSSQGVTLQLINTTGNIILYKYLKS